MSLRRKSCDTCFKGRRKCDQAWPVCTRCERNNKECHYAYPPQADLASSVIGPSSMRPPPRYLRNQVEVHGRSGARSRHGSRLAAQPMTLPHFEVPGSLGNLGELAPGIDMAGWPWVLEQIQTYPKLFANNSETPFIHNSLYRKSAPNSILTAFYLCSKFASLAKGNEDGMFHGVETQILDLLSQPSLTSLAEELAKLQAIVLYQILRLCYGGLRERVVAEQQEFVVRSLALALLHRANAEPQEHSWEAWILIESIRRTVTILFKLYTTYWNFRYGRCREGAAITILPISTKLGSWQSKDRYSEYADMNEIITYGELRSRWGAAQEERLIHLKSWFSWAARESTSMLWTYIKDDSKSVSKRFDRYS